MTTMEPPAGSPALDIDTLRHEAQAAAEQREIERVSRNRAQFESAHGSAKNMGRGARRATQLGVQERCEPHFGPRRQVAVSQGWQVAAATGAAPVPAEDSDGRQQLYSSGVFDHAGLSEQPVRAHDRQHSDRRLEELDPSGTDSGQRSTSPSTGNDDYFSADETPQQNYGYSMDVDAMTESAVSSTHEVNYGYRGPFENTAQRAALDALQLQEAASASHLPAGARSDNHSPCNT